MEKINVSVEKYSGPMDLLLNLIEKNKLDIYDIPLEKITKEYIETINRLTNVSSEEMAEFVSMASTLVYLKSKGLVPKSNYEDFEDEISSKEELERRLLEYKQFKQLSEQMKINEFSAFKIFNKIQEDLEFLKPDAEHEVLENVDLLFNVFNELIEKAKKEKENQIFKNYEFTEEYTVMDSIIFIKDVLTKSKKIEFRKLIKNERNIKEIIALFLSILELLKSSFLKVEQFGIGKEIYLILRED